MSEKPHRHAPQGPKIAKAPHAPSDLMEGKPRCTATSKQAGRQCRRYPIPGGTVCVMHGGGAPQVQKKAMERLMELQPRALNRMGALIDLEAFPTVAYAASRDVLDRTMGKPTEQQTVEHSGTIRMIHEIE